MKLAEALILRANYQDRFNELRNRVLQNVRVQEGEAPAENPQELLAQMEQVAADLTQLIQQINRTNLAAKLENGQTITASLAQRDTLNMRFNAYRMIAQNAVIAPNRVTRSEVRYQTAVDVAELQKLADRLAQAYRELDTQIQAANWVTDLIE